MMSGWDLLSRMPEELDGILRQNRLMNHIMHAQHMVCGDWEWSGRLRSLDLIVGRLSTDGKSRSQADNIDVQLESG